MHSKVNPASFVVVVVVVVVVVFVVVVADVDVDVEEAVLVDLCTPKLTPAHLCAGPPSPRPFMLHRECKYRQRGRRRKRMLMLSNKNQIYRHRRCFFFHHRIKMTILLLAYFSIFSLSTPVPTNLHCVTVPGWSL